MSSPLDDARKRLDRRERDLHLQVLHDKRQSCLARQEVIDAIEDFLERAAKLGNKGTERWRFGFLNYVRLWRVRWVHHDRAGMMLLAPDGRLWYTDGSGTDNNGVPYNSATFFGVNDHDAEAVEREYAAPGFVDIYARSPIFSDYVETMIESLAALLKSMER